jgi:hypothetical protein
MIHALATARCHVTKTPYPEVRGRLREGDFKTIAAGNSLECRVALFRGEAHIGWLSH